MEKNNAKSVVSIAIKRNELQLRYLDGQEGNFPWDGTNFMQQSEKLQQAINPGQTRTKWVFATTKNRQTGQTAYWLWHEDFSPQSAIWMSCASLTESNMKDLMSNQKILGRIKEIFNVDFL